MYVIGEIINTHGIKGDVKVKQITDFPERFHVGNTVYVKTEEDELLPLKIDGARTLKQNMLVHFEGYDSINEVEIFKGLKLYIQKDQQEELPENEYYYHEIIGCTVFTTNGEIIGRIESIMSPGANDIWVVETDNNKEIFIPYIEPVVKQVDVETKKVTIELMEGLID